MRAGINYPLQDLIIDNRFEQISNFCFSGCKNIVNVRFCTNLENIGSYSFYNCQSLEFVNFEKTVKNIGNNAFEGCIALEKIYIGDVIKYIGDNAFYNCNNLKSVNINDLKSWFEINFANYYANPLYYNKNYQGTDKTTNLLIDDIKITSIKTPDNVSQINNYALAGCNSLEVLEISENIETVGENSFFDCNNLRELSIPKSLLLIKKSAFENCKNISKVNIKDINKWCLIKFENCSSNPLSNAYEYSSYSGEYKFGTGANLYLNDKEITKLNLNNGITEINNYAFANCKCLESVTLPDDIGNVGKLAFFNCNNIRSLQLNNSCISIDVSSFNGCDNLTIIKINDLDHWCISNHNFSDLQYKLYVKNIELTDLILPIDTTRIEDYAFAGCSSLKSFTVSQNLTSIGEKAFYNCPNLNKINIESIEKWCDIRLEGNNSPLPLHYLFLNDKRIDEIIIPNGINNINEKTFEKTLLTSVTLPKSVESFNGLNGIIKVFKNSCADEYAKSKNIEVQYLADEIPKQPTIKSVETDQSKNLISIVVEADNYDPYEYSIDLINWQKDKVIKAKFEPNKEYKIYQRIYKTVDFNESYPSEPTIIKTNPCGVKPEAPILSKVTSTSVSLIESENFEYKMDDGEWQSSNVFTELAPNSTHKFYQRVAETDTAYASEPSEALTVTTLKNTVNSPSVPELKGKTVNSVTLKAVGGCEYRMNDGEWQKSNVFTGLSEDTEYTFYQRIAETETSYASESSLPLKVKTEKIHTPDDITGHEWSEWIVTKPAGCTVNGEEQRSCLKCGSAEKRIVRAYGHRLKYTEEKKPTCTEKGHTAYGTCQNEGCTYTDYIEIPPTGHIFGKITVVRPKYGESGYSAHKCTVCGYEEKFDITAPIEYPADKTLVYTDGKWIYLSSGKPDTDYTGLTRYNGT